MWSIRVSQRARFLVTFSDKPLRVALTGARGIGRVHARIFQALGADVCAVLGSSEASSQDAAKMLKESFNIQAKPFYQIETLLREIKPDVLSICTPPHRHFVEIMTALDHEVAVFCEKPIFWYQQITRQEIEENLLRIENHPSRRLFVNTSNSHFIDCILQKADMQKDIRSFYVRFYSQGPYHRRDIAFDLLPHCLSLLLRLCRSRKIGNVTETVEDNTYSCTFQYGTWAVKFDCKEDPSGSKELVFALDDRTFTRIQQGMEATYRVFLTDSLTKEKIETEDPFKVFIRKFLDYCCCGAPVRQDGYEEAASNLRLMADIVLCNGTNKYNSSC
jgi:predicted dehydrogenase